MHAMTTTTAPADLFGLAIGHARQLGRGSERRVGLVAAAARSIFRFALHPVSFVCSYVDRLTEKVTDQAVWFQGVAASLNEGTPLVEASGVSKDDLIAELERAQQTLMGLRRQLLRTEADLSSAGSTRIAASMRRLLAAATQAFDAVEAARWAVMERQADEDIAAGRVGPTYTNADDFMASLRD
jgi:hypothetical protein